MAEPATKRPFQFSLLAMFVVVAIVAMFFGWLGWNVKIVQDRKAIRDWIFANGGFVGMLKDADDIKNGFSGDPSIQPESISPLRRLLGDESVRYIAIPRSATREDIDRISKAFPGAWQDSSRSKRIYIP